MPRSMEGGVPLGVWEFDIGIFPLQRNQNVPNLNLLYLTTCQCSTSTCFHSLRWCWSIFLFYKSTKFTSMCTPI